MKQKAQVGDVFLIPIDASRHGVGQIAGDWKGELYILVFDVAHVGSDINPSSINDMEPLFAALSLDAKIYNGDWKIVGRTTENLDRIVHPVFKVNQDKDVFLESRDRSITRPISDEDAEALRFRTVVAPVRLEKALKAYNGIGEWNSRYDDLRYEYALRSSEYLNS